MTITLTTLSNQGVSIDVDPSPLPEAGPHGVTITFGLHDGPFAVTLTADETRQLMAELMAVLAFAD